MKRTSLLLAIFMLSVMTVGYSVKFGGEQEYAVKEITVTNGRTWWDIASENTPSGMDKREYIFEAKKLNGRSGSDLYAGERIKIMIYEE